MKAKPKRQPVLYIERMRDWNFGAFRTATCASCIAIGTTVRECAKAGIRRLELNDDAGRTQETPR
jgi:hypothetical protein